MSRGKLCICDLDGVVVDTTARFAEAEEAKQAFLRSPESIDHPNGYKHAEGLFWKTAFTPELATLDTLVEGAKRALETLRYTAKYDLLFLTSRPETMRAATIQWLLKHNILFYGPLGLAALIMKGQAFQFTKTTTWKVGMVEALIPFYGTHTLLFIDDEETNCEALRSATLPIAPRYYHSLSEAVEALKEEGHV